MTEITRIYLEHPPIEREPELQIVFPAEEAATRRLRGHAADDVLKQADASAIPFLCPPPGDLSIPYRWYGVTTTNGGRFNIELDWVDPTDHLNVLAKTTEQSLGRAVTILLGKKVIVTPFF